MNNFIKQLKIVPLFFLLISWFLSCGEVVTKFNPPEDSTLQGEVVSDQATDTILELYLLISNTGLAHGWGYLFKAKITDVVLGEIRQDSILKFELNTGCYAEWENYLPKSPGEPLPFSVSFRYRVNDKTYNPGICGFIDNKGRLWEISDFSPLDIIEYRLSAFLDSTAREWDEIEATRNTTIFARLKYMDHFTRSFKKKTTISYGDVDGIYPRFDLYYYSYEEGRKVSQLINELLKSFAEDVGHEIAYGQYEKSIKTAPLFAIIGTHDILLLKYSCEHLSNDWEAIKKLLKAQFEIPESDILDVNCGGPLLWELHEKK